VFDQWPELYTVVGEGNPDAGREVDEDLFSWPKAEVYFKHYLLKAPLRQESWQSGSKKNMTHHVMTQQVSCGHRGSYVFASVWEGGGVGADAARTLRLCWFGST
jgi:hypothetical protein